MARFPNFKGKIKAIQLVNVRVIVQTVLSFFQFCFLNALQRDINSNRVYVLGHKYVLGFSQTASRAQNIIIYAREHKLNGYVSLWVMNFELG